MQLSDTRLHIVLVWMQGLLNILDAWFEADSNIQAVSYALNNMSVESFSMQLTSPGKEMFLALLGECLKPLVAVESWNFY